MSNSRKTAVSVRSIKKSFRLPNESHSGIKQLVLSVFKRDRKKGYEIQEVLKDISFDVKKGEFFGIVGRNGSGKSTLLKLLAGIYTPDSGAVVTNGSIVPFIELGVGFNPELTGRENVFLNGALLGFSHDEMEAMYDDIVSFAELERFMDQKLKNYSSGMQVRLAFSIAIKAQGDILILDEVLAVGDEAFQRKCNNFFDQIKKDKSKTVILVTHSMESVQKYCDRAIMLRDGDIVAEGNPSDVSNEYSLENFRDNREKDDDKEVQNSLVSDFHIRMISNPILKPGDIFEADLVYELTDNIDTNFGISILDKDYNYVLLNDGKDVKKSNVDGEMKYKFRYKWRVPEISSRKLSMVATLNHYVNGERRAISFTDDSQGINFLVMNEKTSTKSLMTRRGSWSRVD